ncbi:unnamed protein product [Polarella glacialis]|uniref:Uncharacterized protein n=1 Tax=Polarella glacialis TaxID=89957 RepID=A0A813FNG0_POLGL|nr:unnamed protein product [Polarella glacialis]
MAGPMERSPWRGRRSRNHRVLARVAATAAGVLGFGAVQHPSVSLLAFANSFATPAFVQTCQRNFCNTVPAAPLTRLQQLRRARASDEDPQIALEEAEQLYQASMFLGIWDKVDKEREEAGRENPAGMAAAGSIAQVDDLRAATKALTRSSGVSGPLFGLRLGIMAPDGPSALKALASWREGLQLPGQNLVSQDVRAVDDDNRPADMDAVAAGPVYLKYSYASPWRLELLAAGGVAELEKDITGQSPAEEAAYMKPLTFPNRGVLFRPELSDGRVRMYGDLPLALFDGES